MFQDHVHKAWVVSVSGGDDPDEVHDRIHDALQATRPQPGAPPEYALIVVDLVDMPQAEFGRWMKAVGEQIPDARLRVAVGPARLKVAHALKLPAFFEWYGSVEDALRGGV